MVLGIFCDSRVCNILIDSLFYIIFQIFHLYPFLLSSVAVTDSNSIVREGIKVYYDAKWCADFILATVALADIAIVIPSHTAELRLERCIDFGIGVLYKLGLIFE